MPAARQFDHQFLARLFPSGGPRDILDALHSDVVDSQQDVADFERRLLAVWIRINARDQRTLRTSQAKLFDVFGNHGAQIHADPSLGSPLSKVI